MRTLLCGLLLSALALSAAEITGKWSGSFDITNSDGATEADTAYMSLKQNGGEVTGTAGPNADKQWTIQKGKLADHLSSRLSMPWRPPSTVNVRLPVWQPVE